MAEARPGNSLTLTIDTKAQRNAQKALMWAMKDVGMKRGVVIVMNPQTGEVLAMVSLPTYDNNQFARGISNAAFSKLLNNPDKPLTNHATQAHYPPGSTYKLVAGTGALADGKITPTTRVQTRGYLTLGSTKFYDWNQSRVRGLQHLLRVRSLERHVLLPDGRQARDRSARLLGQASTGSAAPTGIDLPGEVAGIVPTNAWKQDVLGSPDLPGRDLPGGHRPGL